jgi:hypothetical protein
MPLYEHKPHIEDIKKNSTSRIYFYCRNLSGSAVNLTGGTVSVTFTPRTEGSSWVRSGSLSMTPSAEPQCYVDVLPADTASVTPQLVDVFATVTVGGTQYKPSGFFRLLQS